MQLLRNRNGKEIKGQFIELATGYYLNLVDGRKYFGELVDSEGGGSSSNWILADGVWNDDGVWDDDAQWIDNT